MVEFVRAVVRPSVTLAFVVMFVAAVFTGDVGEIPEWLRTVGIATIAYWFASRPAEKLLNGR